jgi:hypothetical protein
MKLCVFMVKETSNLPFSQFALHCTNYGIIAGIGLGGKLGPGSGNTAVYVSRSSIER